MTDRNKRRRHRIVTGALLPVGLLAAGCSGDGGAAASASGESCYDGETVNIVVPFSPGGGYDLIARAAAPEIEERLGATVVIDNQPGAGGLTAANKIYAEAGSATTFGFFAGQGILGAVLGGSAGATFDVEEFTYIGRLANDPRLMVGSKQSGLTDADDLRAADNVRYATLGVGSAPYLDGVILERVLGMNTELITGFEGTGEAELAVTSGQADVTSNSVATQYPGVERGDVEAVLVISSERVEELPDVPTLLEAELGDEERELAEAYIQLQAIGRALIGPPEMPADCVAELQEAFGDTLADPEFMAGVEKQIDVPLEFLPGEELDAIVQDVLNAPEAFKALLEKAYDGS
jgi:tripartite-type tricarboxylate transporter receptor subunit TctC